MRRLNVWLGVVLGWTFLIGSVHELGGSLILSAVTGKCALVVLLALLVVPRAARLAWPWLVLPPVAMLLGIKAWLGYSVLGEGTPQTVVDVAAIVISTLLAARAAASLDEFSEALSRATLLARAGRPQRFRHAQWRLFREVQRARYASQPLTLLSVSARAEDPAALRDQMTEEALRAMADEYAQSRVAELLRNEVRACDTVARRNRHLVAILPATTAEEAEAIVRRVRDRARNLLGLQVSIGKASFPAEELTLVGLLERAETAMGQQRREEDQRAGTRRDPRGTIVCNGNGEAASRRAPPSAEPKANPAASP